MKEIQALGQACYDFYRALELLYVRSSEGKNLLRNRELLAPWVAEYLNRGKPDSLVDYGLGRGVRGALPPVIRPDLLVTDEGFAMTELDSVPGGIGLTAFLMLYIRRLMDRNWRGAMVIRARIWWMLSIVCWRQRHRIFMCLI